MRLLRSLESNQDLLFDQADAAARVGTGTRFLEVPEQFEYLVVPFPKFLQIGFI
jgi:hypothetical protein